MQITPEEIKSPDEDQGHISLESKEKILKDIKSQTPIEVWLALREAIKYSNFDETEEPFSIQRLFGHTFGIKRVPQHYGLYEILLEDANRWDEIDGLYKLSNGVTPPSPRTIWQPGFIADWLLKNGISISIKADPNKKGPMISWDFSESNITHANHLGGTAVESGFKN